MDNRKKETKTKVMNSLYRKSEAEKTMEIGEIYRSNSAKSEIWLGFEKFPLIDHSEKKEKESGGKRQQKRKTKSTPWLVIALAMS